MTQRGVIPPLPGFASGLVSQRPLLLLSKFITLLTHRESGTGPGEGPALRREGSSQVRVRSLALSVREVNIDHDPKSKQALGTNVPRLN